MALRKDCSVRQNLFVATTHYSQHNDLSFKNPSLNSRFKIESARINQPNLKALLLIGAAACFVFGLYQLDFSLLAFSVASCFLACAPMKTRIQLPVLTILLILPQLALADQGGLAESILVFLPTALVCLFHSAHWRDLLWASGMQMVVVRCFSNIATFELAIGLAGNVGVYSLLERFLLDLWILADSYKKSNTLHWEMFNSFKEGTLIVDLEGVVKYHNKAACKFIDVHMPMLNINVKRLFPDHIQIDETIRQVAKGKSTQTIVTLSNLVQNHIMSPHRILAYKLTATPANWVGGNCIKITLQDVTSKMKQLALTHVSLNDMQNSFSILTRELDRCFKYEEPPRREDLMRLDSITYNVHSIICWQMVCLGSIEFKHRLFDIRSEVIDTIESSITKYLDKLEDTMLILDTNFPTAVVGDCDQHNQLLRALLMFALNDVVPDASIKIYCDVSVFYRQAASDNDFKLRYKLVYQSVATHTEALKYLQTREDRDLDTIISLSKQFGIAFAMFPIILEAMDGIVHDSCIQGLENKVSLSYR